MATKQTITPLTLLTEGLRVARNHVRALLRSKGIKISSFSYADLQRMAKSYLELHREELIGQALGSLAWAHCVKFLSDARRAERAKSRASTVQISGSEVEA
jgi:hypothetical protein